MAVAELARLVTWQQLTPDAASPERVHTPSLHRRASIGAPPRGAALRRIAPHSHHSRAMRRGHGGGHAAASRPRGDGFVADLEYNPDLIPQTRALKEYRLNPNDLKPLKVTRTTNPRDPSYAPMKLYNIWDLKVRPCGTLRDAIASGEGPVAA